MASIVRDLVQNAAGSELSYNVADCTLLCASISFLLTVILLTLAIAVDVDVDVDVRVGVGAT